MQEIEIAAKLAHPHILPLFDSGEAGGFLFYVMPYVEGESLRDRLGRAGRMPVADAVRITTQVASALDYAHDQGVIHRDIKPENILLAGDQAVVAALGRGFKSRGYPGAWKAAADTMARRSRDTNTTAFAIAAFYARAGATIRTLDWLERAVVEHDQNIPYIGVQPLFRDLHDDPRFRRLAAEAGVPLTDPPGG